MVTGYEVLTLKPLKELKLEGRGSGTPVSFFFQWKSFKERKENGKEGRKRTGIRKEGRKGKDGSGGKVGEREGRKSVLAYFTCRIQRPKKCRSRR